MLQIFATIQDISGSDSKISVSNEVRLKRELWLRITNTFDAALERAPAERSSFLARTCAGDKELFEEVSRLLSEFENAGDFLERPFATPASAVSTGELIADRYRVEALLGRGGMGEGYLVHDELLDERLALKTLRPEFRADPDGVRRFQREVRIARQVTHPNVCRVFEIGVHDRDGRRLDFFVMELLEGETLAARVQRKGRISRDEAHPLIMQMVSGLQAAHDAGIVHRDFKSANVILCKGRAVITDFGLARGEPGTATRVGGTITSSAVVAGTVAYMSPEQLSGSDITPATDIYSLGVVLFEMATGRLPFDDRHIIHSAMQRAAESTPNVRALAPDIDSEWAAVIARCLQRDPANRFARPADVAACFRPGGFPVSMSWLPASRWFSPCGNGLLRRPALFVWRACPQRRSFHASSDRMGKFQRELRPC